VSRRLIGVAVTAVTALTALAGCGGSGDGDAAEGLPKVELIDPAVAAVADELGAAPELLEVAATLEGVDIIVRTAASDDGDAALYRYDADDGLTGPIEPRIDERETFSPDQIDIQPDRLFDQISEELPDTAVLDFAIYVDGGVVVNDATLASENGGVMFVLLSGDGQIGGLQAE
jgi:hypothetical protein